jgi:hypothetical protein
MEARLEVQVTTAQLPPTKWQPWLALLGIACVAGVPLSGIAFRLNVDLGQQLTAYRTYGVHFGTLLTSQQDMAL